MPEPTRRTSDRTREALLSAGSELFADRGFDGASTEEIARAAGVNKALINYHFGGKEGLYRAILKDTLAPAIERIGHLQEDPRPARELLRDLVTIYVEAVRLRPALPRMLLPDILHGGGRVLDPEVLSYIRLLLQTVIRIVERGIAEGTFRPVSPIHVHLTLVASLNVFFGTIPFRRRLHEAGVLPTPPDADPAPFAAYVTDLLIRGLAAPGSPA